jgi:hypothetical protein
MRQKPHHPDKGVTGKKTYYQTRGRVHLTKNEHTTYCGVDLENVNGTTTEIISVTCQRCLMHKTKNWGGKERGKCGGGDVTHLLKSERELNSLKKPDPLLWMPTVRKK